MPVTRGSRLTINNYAGEVVIRTWDKDALRVQARHSAKVTIDVQTTGNAVQLRSKGSEGPGAGIDYEITAPTWMPVKVSGQFLYVGIEGAHRLVAVAAGVEAALGEDLLAFVNDFDGRGAFVWIHPDDDAHRLPSLR